MNTEVIYLFRDGERVYFSFTAWAFKLPLIATRHVAFVDGKIVDVTDAEDEEAAEQLLLNLTNIGKHPAIEGVAV